MSLGQCIDMDGDKQIGLILVGNLRTFIQLHELIGLTGIDDLHVGTFLFHKFSEGKGKLQSQVLFLDTGIADGPGIASAMSGIDDQRKPVVCSSCDGCKTEYRYQK